MKGSIWIGAFVGIMLMAAMASAHSERSCSYCLSYEDCFPCARTNTVWCSASWPSYYRCCTSSYGFASYCTSSGCCTLTGLVLRWIIIGSIALAIFIAAFIVFWCIRTRRRRMQYESVSAQPEVVEVHHYQQPAYVQTTTSYGAVDPLQPVGVPVQTGYQATYSTY